MVPGPSPAFALLRGAVPPLALALSALAALAVEQARRVAHARSLAGQAPAVFTRAHRAPLRRALLVGDSTGAGVGCSHAQQSIAACLARDFDHAEVRNLCGNGATVADVLRTVRALPAPARRCDLVLVFAGGNDVLCRTPARRLQGDVQQLLAVLRGCAGQVIWVGMANVGLAPLFLPPLSWWMTARTRRVNRLLAREVRAAGARFEEFFQEQGHDPFSAQPARFYARDGVHPSAQAYAWCYARMRPAIARALAP